ncbi:MAG TPA: catalase HPII [Clostridiales bacterium]|nr:catalase HPII [Clostridiales bacterium]
MNTNQNGLNMNEHAKNNQLAAFRVKHDDQVLTTDQGVHVSNTDDSLTAGARGPTLMEDFHFREKLTHFDHERIPERVVHARGFGVHGYFQVYEPMTQLTKAKFLQDPNVKTPVFTRFSTVVGSRGSADTVRDVRGFAVKFYTEDGNLDITGNNMPIFFIQDAIKFPDLVHAIKPEPDNEIPQAASAHDTFWDFVVNTPELTHMIMWLMSDRAIPRSYRMMEGFGVNTFRLINEQGIARFVRFHWKPLLGVHSLVWDEAQKISGKDPDFHRRDIWDAINKGEFPEYEFGIQVIEEQDEFKFGFDILDPTKFWPEELIPVKIIGKMTLNKNVENFFAETEQVAFCPSNIVPGLDFSNDPLLQGRLFSYLDTQLIRLGGPNFHEIPINRSIAPVHNNQRDGYHRMTIDHGKVSYSPNSLANNRPNPCETSGYQHYQEKVEGVKIRARSLSFQDHFSQATMFWNSMSPPEKQHIINAFQFEVGSVKDKQIKQRVVDLFNNVDHELAKQIAIGVGATQPGSGRTGASETSPAVSQLNTIMTAKTRKVAILAEDGFNHAEVSKLMNSLNGAGVCFEVISKNLGTIKSSDQKELEVVKNHHTGTSVLYDAVYVAGGRASVDAMLECGEALHFVNEAFKHCKTVGAANEGVDLLKVSSITGVNYSKGENIVSELGVLTQNKADNLTEFCKQFIDAIAKHRHWERESVKGTVPA